MKPINISKNTHAPANSPYSPMTVPPLKEESPRVKKIGLIGFGRTGKAVASVILQSREFCLQWVLRRNALLETHAAAEFLGIDSDEPGTIFSVKNMPAAQLLEVDPVDIIIDFSSNQGIYSYGEAAARKGIIIISAISHYQPEELELLQQLSQKTAVFWSPNITLGVNYLMFAAKFLKKIAPWVDIEIIEEHFKQKNGVSGTAVKIAELLDVEQSTINSVRAGGIVGKHEIIFGFPYQTVRLTHEAISREAFGNGVIFVAQNLHGKAPGLYHFDDVLLPYFAEGDQPEFS